MLSTANVWIRDLTDPNNLIRWICCSVCLDWLTEKGMNLNKLQNKYNLDQYKLLKGEYIVELKRVN